MQSGRATSYDVARLAGVSQSAVSRTFSPNGSVSKKTREKVLAAAAQLNFAPNAVAQSLSLGRSKLVGLVVTQYSHLNYPVALKSAVDILAGTGDSVLLQIVDAADRGDNAVDRLLQFRVDMIISTASLTEGAATACREAGVPLALINRRLDLPGIDHVSSNHAEMMRRLALQLKATGVRGTVFLDGPEMSWVSAERRRGFLLGCDEAGLPEPNVVPGEFLYQGGYDAIRELGAGLLDADAVVSANDPMAIGAIDALRFEFGMQLPDDIQVVGHDDTPTAGHRAYRLTTVRQQMDVMLERAIELAYARLDDLGRPEADLVLDSRLVVRESSRLRDD